MKRIKYKMFGSYIALFMIVNAGWLFSILYLIPVLLPSQRTLFALEGFFVWVLFLTIGLLLLRKPIGGLHATLNAVSDGQDVSDEILSEALRQSSTLPKLGLTIYMTTGPAALLVTFILWKFARLGTISAASIFCGVLPVVTACAFMQHAAFTSLTVEGNELLTLAAEKRNLTLHTSTRTMGISKKIYINFAVIAIGLLTWYLGFTYYSVLNYIVTESKTTSLAFHAIVEKSLNIAENEQDISLQLEKMISQTSFGEKGFLFLVDPYGDVQILTPDRSLFVEHWDAINQRMREDFKNRTPRSMFDNVDEKIVTYTPLNKRYMLGTVSYLSEKLPSAKFWIWALIYGSPAYIVIVVLGRALSSTILHSVRAIADLIEHLIRGCLYVRHGTSNFDETGTLVLTINRFLGELTAIIEKITTVAHKVSSSSRQVWKVAERVSQGASQQASSTEEISSSMTEMAASIKMNADNAQKANRIAQQVAEHVSSVKTAVIDTKQAMVDIVDKVSVINDFAGKTNLLSLNASVEAARAGDAGRGFGVVAGEIRNLAQQSLEAAQVIEQVSSASLAQAERSEELLTKLIPTIMSTSALVQEISASSIEQSSGTNQVNQAVWELAAVTQQNSVAAENMARSSDALTSHASLLLDTMSFFKSSEDEISHISDKELEKKLEELTSQLQTLQTVLERRKNTDSHPLRKDAVPQEEALEALSEIEKYEEEETTLQDEDIDEEFTSY